MAGYRMIWVRTTSPWWLIDSKAIVEYSCVVSMSSFWSLGPSPSMLLGVQRMICFVRMPRTNG
jgi:hypothetical protein